MKELSIEEKAKVYDEALIIAKQWYNDSDTTKKEKYLLKGMFSELVESEDERIRKEIIDFLGLPHPQFVGKRDHEKWIAWLEKQREQKHTPKHKIGDTIYYNSFGEVKSMVVSDVVMDSTDDPMYEDKEGNAVFDKDLIEQKPAWSEEDEKILSNIIKDLVHPWNEYIPDRIEEEIKWLKNKLKSLKDKCLPQPQQEWSKEDEDILNTIINHFKRDIECTDEDDVIRWLKSLRPQWKPNEEMLEALYRAIPKNVMEISEDEMLLDKLYQGLKYGRVLSEK